MTDILGFGYAAVVAIGGIIGYVKAGKWGVSMTKSGKRFCGIKSSRCDRETIAHIK